MVFKFISRPGMRRLEEITEWLREERQTCGEGFYCNITVISKGFHDKKAYCITWRNKAIGFLIYSASGKKGRIEIAEVHPAFRGRGVGRSLIEGALTALAARGVLVLDLECQPVESERFWRLMGFSAMPDGVDENHYHPYSKSIVLFRPTQGSQSSIFNGTAENVVELWDCPPWESKDRPPKWTWPVRTYENSKHLLKPIVHPANADWRLRCRFGAEVICDDKMKYVCNDQRIGSFIVLTQLPEC